MSALLHVELLHTWCFMVRFVFVCLSGLCSYFCEEMSQTLGDEKVGRNWNKTKITKIQTSDTNTLENGK